MIKLNIKSKDEPKKETKKVIEKPKSEKKVVANLSNDKKTTIIAKAKKEKRAPERKTEVKEEKVSALPPSPPTK